jgi:hypothetical protein
VRGWQSVTTASWLLIVAVAVLVTGGYRYSLWRNPTRACHSCNGGGKHRAWVWAYAAGDCTARTVLPPRVRCDRGRIPRYGVRVLHLENKK